MNPLTELQHQERTDYILDFIEEQRSHGPYEDNDICLLRLTYGAGKWDQANKVWTEYNTHRVLMELLKDNVLGHVYCKNQAEVEGEYGPEGCMHCNSAYLDVCDGRGNKHTLDHGHVIEWMSDHTFRFLGV